MRESIRGVKKVWTLASRAVGEGWRKCLFSGLGFLTLGTVDILGWIIFCFAGHSCALWDV